MSNDDEAARKAKSRARFIVADPIVADPAPEDPSEGISIFNFCGVTAKGNQVVILMPPRSGTLDPEDALRFAAWLIAGAELAGEPRALEVADALVKRILST